MPPTGLPLLHPLPCACMLSPVPRRRRPACFVRAPLGEIGRWQPSPRSRRGGLRIDVFEARSAFTRVAACTLAEPPEAALFHRSASVRFVTSTDCSDCYRLERTTCRAGLSPAGVRCLGTAHRAISPVPLAAPRLRFFAARRTEHSKFPHWAGLLEIMPCKEISGALGNHSSRAATHIGHPSIRASASAASSPSRTSATHSSARTVSGRPPRPAEVPARATGVHGDHPDFQHGCSSLVRKDSYSTPAIR